MSANNLAYDKGAAAALLGTDWTRAAACRGLDPEMFYADRGGSVTEAKAICARCPVREACLEYALAAGEKWGVWGGLSERQRRRIRIARRSAA